VGFHLDGLLLRFFLTQIAATANMLGDYLPIPTPFCRPSIAILIDRCILDSGKAFEFGKALMDAGFIRIFS
jgi:hypothetical protein